MPRRIHPNCTYRNDMDLPLFAWADRQDETPTEPVQRSAWKVRALARDTGLPAHRARLVAGFLGIELEEMS